MPPKKLYPKHRLLLPEDPSQPNPQFYDPDDHHLDTYIPQQGIRDSQYQNLMNTGSKKPKKAMKATNIFDHDERYKGRRVDLDMPVEEENQELEQDEEEEDQTNLAQAYKKIKKDRKIDTNLLEEKLREIRQEDQQIVNEVPQQTTVSSKNLSNQLSVSSDLVEIRYNFEKTFQEVKRLPFSTAPRNGELNQKATEVRASVLKSIESLREIQRELFGKVTEREIIEEEVNTQQSITEQYKNYKQQTKPVMKFIEQSLVKWSNKTTLLNQVGQSGYSSLLMQTPVGQAQRVLTSLDKILPKSRMKRGVFRTLFSPPEQIRNSQNEQIFDDFQLFHQIAKNYEEHLDKHEIQHHDKVKTKNKDVDRKASKNRKVRFNVEPKLVNFMASQDNPYLLEARDEILKNIFNSGPKQQVIDYIDF